VLLPEVVGAVLHAQHLATAGARHRPEQVADGLLLPRRCSALSGASRNATRGIGSPKRFVASASSVMRLSRSGSTS
jgi:hypothetical protein